MLAANLRKLICIAPSRSQQCKTLPTFFRIFLVSLVPATLDVLKILNLDSMTFDSEVSVINMPDLSPELENTFDERIKLHAHR
jgi:hypothetical protein